MPAPRHSLHCMLLLVASAACGPFEFLTTRPPTPETFEACVRRLWAAFEPADVLDERRLETLVRAECGAPTCNGPCSACIEDADCGSRRLCTRGACQACPDVSRCLPPATGLGLLSRNGCPVCQFAPPSECLSDADCSDGTCQRGALCADGCERLDCCANVCAPGACHEPAPLGCMAMCDDPAVIAPECRTTACTCANGRWSCDSTPSNVVLGTCVYHAL